MRQRRLAPGTRLLGLAERLFDRTTLDRVIVPAIADLQHECSQAPGPSLSNRLITARAYGGVVRTIVACATRDVAWDRDGVSRDVARRMLLIVPLLLTMTAPGNGWLVPFGASVGAGVAARAGALLLLANLVLVLPIAFYFAVALHRRQSRLEAMSIAACSLACVAVMAALMMVIVPQTNQSYRLLVFTALSHDGSPPRPLDLPKGLTELTLSELNDRIAHSPSTSQEAAARYHRQERFAYTAAPMVLGFVALSLARQRRPRVLVVTLAVTLGALYYLAFINDPFHSATALAARAWTANALLALIGLALHRSAGAALETGGA